METFSALLALCAGNSPVSGEFPTQRPVTRSFDVFFDLRLIKRLSKNSRGWWFETLSHPLWRHCNEKCLWYNNSDYKLLKFGLCSQTLQDWTNDAVLSVTRPCPVGLYSIIFLRRTAKVMFSCLFVCLSACLSIRLPVSNITENRWANFHEIFTIGVAWYQDQSGIFRRCYV